MGKNDTPAAPPAAPTNPFAGIFGKVHFSLPTGKNQPLKYENGSVQHNLADAAVEFGTTGSCLKGRIVAVVAPGSKKASVEFKWLTTGGAAFRQSVVKSLDDEAKMRMDTYRVSVVREYQVWRAAQPKAVQNAPKTIGGVEADLEELGIASA